MKPILIASILAFISGPVWGADACAPIESACKDAGYQLPAPRVEGDEPHRASLSRGRAELLREKKDLRFNCLKPILKGESVSGVTPSPTWDLNACRDEMKARWKAKRGKWKDGKKRQAPAQ